MRDGDLGIAIVGIGLMAIGVVLSLVDILMSENWILGLAYAVIIDPAFIVAGIGFLYVAFSKKYREEP
jgi:hypothetical protein